MSILEILGVIFLVLILISLSPLWIPVALIIGWACLFLSLVFLPVILIVVGIVLIITSSGLIGWILLILGILSFIFWYKDDI